MKTIRSSLIMALCLIPVTTPAQNKIENVIIVTCDGLRWQEVFKGMDSTLASDSRFNERDSAFLFQRFWNADLTERRSKLFPFLWEIVAHRGQLYGNRSSGNKVDIANPYWFSYPGYSEIFCGFVDTLINTNDYPPNPNMNVLEFLHQNSRFSGKVAAFCAWDAFNRILNESRSRFPVIAAFDACGGNSPTVQEQLINSMRKDSYKPWGDHECLDVFTHFAAFEHLKTRKPRVLYIAYGETDEWAHSGKYSSYISAAHQVDSWLRQMWDYVQEDPFYRDRTAFFITVDHGRGDLQKDQWTDHGESVPDSHQLWFAVIGPGIPTKGEVTTPMQLYQKQFAQTIAFLLGTKFTAEHPVAEKVDSIFR